MTEEEQQAAQRVLARVRAGTLLAKAMREEDVSSHFWRKWISQTPSLVEALAEAREEGYDVIAADSLDIVDGLKPIMGVPSEAGRDRARADHRLKLLARLDPKRYGERVQVADADGNKLTSNPIVLDVLAMLRPAVAQGAPQEAIEAQPVVALPKGEETR